MVSILSKCTVTCGEGRATQQVSFPRHAVSFQKAARGWKVSPAPRLPPNSGFEGWVRGLSWPPTDPVAFGKLLLLDFKFLNYFYTSLLVFSNYREEGNKLNDTMRNNQPNPESRTFHRMMTRKKLGWSGFRVGLLKLSTADTLDSVVLCGGDCYVHCRVLKKQGTTELTQKQKI